MAQLLSVTTIVYIVILVVTIIINGIGLHLLFKTKGAYTNQKLILMHLSGCEILLAISRLLYRVLDYYKIPVENKLKQGALIFLYIELSTYYLIVICLTVDRFIASRYPLKYSRKLSKRRMKILLVISWIIGLSVNFPQLFISSKLTVFIFNYATLPCLDFGFLCFAGITYGYIFKKVRKRNGLTIARQQMKNGRRRRESLQCARMAAIITFRFFLLIVVPDIIFAVYFTANFASNNALRVVLIIAWYVNPIFDPITYIFMQRKMRVSFKQIYCCKKRLERDQSKEVSSSKTDSAIFVIDTKL